MNGMRLAVALIFLLLGLPILFGFLALQSFPAVANLPTTEAANAEMAKYVLKRLRDAFQSRKRQRIVSISQSELNSVMLFAARAVPSFRGRTNVSSKEITFAMSAIPPGLPADRWLNLELAVSPSRQGLEISSIRIGDIDLPPGIILPFVTFAIDMALGDELGSLILDGVDSVMVSGRTVSIGISISPLTRELFLARSKARTRQINPFGDTADAESYYLAVHKAAEVGILPNRGSFLPYLRFAFGLTHQQAADGDAVAEMRSAMLAVGVYCGLRQLEILVGNVAPESLRNQPAHCRKTTLNGRVDLRLHFIISAVLRVASDAGATFAIGEFKELRDANGGGSGFSFDDIAADLAGARFAETLFANATTSETRRILLGRMKRESEVFPNIEGLPVGLSDSEFKRRFGDVDSVPYKTMLTVIEKRIDKLLFHART